MERKEFYYTSTDQITKIHAAEWIPEGKPVAILQISHGITEHILRYEKVAEYFTNLGILVVGNDHLGHGLSINTTTDFMYCEKWENLVGDLYTLQDMEQKKYPDIPYYVLGFSLGSFVVRNYLSQYPGKVNAAILMGTGMTPRIQIMIAYKIVKWEAKKSGERNSSPLIRKLSFETYNKQFVPNQTKCDWLCKDKDGLATYFDDELCGENISAGLFRELLRGMEITGRRDMIEKLPKELPVLLVSGQQDPVGDQGKGVSRYAHSLKKAGMECVTEKLYPGRHDILHEACCDTVLQDIAEWIQNLKVGK